MDPIVVTDISKVPAILLDTLEKAWSGHKPAGNFTVGGAVPNGDGGRVFMERNDGKLEASIYWFENPGQPGYKKFVYTIEDLDGAMEQKAWKAA